MAILEQVDDNNENDMDQEPPDQDNMNNQEQVNDGQQQNDNNDKSSGGCSIQSGNDINIDNIYSQLLAILILLSVTIKKRIRKKIFY